jgi:hydrogenase nickel incorporation protein HypB
MTQSTKDIGLSLLDATEDRGRIVTVERGVMAFNNQIAARLRRRFTDAQTLVLNVMSSPGSGKTALLGRTLEHFRHLNPAVIVGDIATDNDADRLRVSGATTAQIQTNGICHLEAAMIERAVDAVGLQHRGLLVIENVGNLVCPASYDLGEELRVVLLSVTEGEDKPLKYPKAFKGAHAVIINKMDIAEAVDFDLQAARTNIHLVSPHTPILEVSARNGAGLENWYAFLNERLYHADDA